MGNTKILEMRIGSRDLNSNFLGSLSFTTAVLLLHARIFQ